MRLRRRGRRTGGKPGNCRVTDVKEKRTDTRREQSAVPKAADGSMIEN